jgi:hypothetical protein
MQSEDKVHSLASPEMWKLRLSSEQFDYLVRKSRVIPTLDATPNPANAVVKECCSSETPFYKKDLSNQCIFLAPPAHSKTIEAYLNHYLEQKSLHPELSAIIILPDSLRSTWAIKAHESFELFANYPNWSRIWDKDENGKFPAEPWGYNCYVDRATPIVPHQISAALKNNLLFSMSALVSGRPARVTALKEATSSLDSAFEGLCLLNKHLALHMGLAIRETSLKSEWGDGTPLTVVGETTITIQIQKFKCTVVAVVVDLGTSFDILLGQQWLRKYQAIMDFGKLTVTFKKGKKSFVTKLPEFKQRVRRTLKPITAQRLAAILRRAEADKPTPLFVCLIQDRIEATPPAIEPEVVRQIKEEFKDVITKVLPSQVPENKPCDFEVIPTLPSEKKPYQPCYRYSPMEKEEIKKQVEELLLAG